MTAPRESSTTRERVINYGAVAVVLVILAVIGLIAWRSTEETEETNQKADQLIAALDTAGARVPSRDQIVGVLGDDGGAVCANANDVLGRAALLAQLANGSGGPGTRPMIAPRKLVQAQLLVMSIYCPDELSEFRQFVDGLKTTEG